MKKIMFLCGMMCVGVVRGETTPPANIETPAIEKKTEVGAPNEVGNKQNTLPSNASKTNAPKGGKAVGGAIAAPEGAVKKKKKKRKKKYRKWRRSGKKWPSNPLNDFSEKAPTLIGLRITGDGNLGKVSYDGNSSSGIGFSGGLQIAHRIIPRLRITAWAAYQRINLSRSLDTSTSFLQDPNPVEVTQTRNYLAVGATAGYLVKKSKIGTSNFILWSVDGGFEYLHPLSASQTDSFSGEQELTQKDRLFFVLLGPTGTAKLSDSIFLTGGIYGTYNLAKNNGSSLLGARFGVAVQVPM